MNHPMEQSSMLHISWALPHPLIAIVKVNQGLEFSA